MRLRNWRLTAVLLATLTSAACGGANLETSSVPTGNAGDTVDETTTAPQQIDETAADSTTSEPVTAEVSDETTTTETPTPSPSTVPARDEIDPETGAPQALIDNLNERGISIDEYLEWYPSIDFSYRQPDSPEPIVTAQLPDDYVAPLGWVTTRIWPDDADLGPTYNDPRTDAFSWASNSRVIDGWNSKHQSPALVPSATSAFDLVDGLYAVTGLKWDTTTPDQIAARLSEFIDCGDMRFAIETGTCSDLEYAKGDFEPWGNGMWVTVPLDDRLTVNNSSHFPCPGEQWLCWSTKIGQGPDFAEQLQAFDRDLRELVIDPNAAGTSWADIGDSLEGGPFSSAPSTHQEITIWSRESLPAITLKAWGPYLQDEAGETVQTAVPPYADWTYAYDSSSSTTCRHYLITRSGNELPPSEADSNAVPCIALMDPMSVNDVLGVAAGSLHLNAGRIGINLSWESTGG